MAIKISFSHIRTNAIETLIRFPLTIFFSILSVASIIYLFHISYYKELSNEYIWKLPISLNIGALLSIAGSVYYESTGRKKTVYFTYLLAAVLLSVGYFFYINSIIKLNETETKRYALITIALHLLIAFAPFIKSKKLNAFWQYNKILFLALLKSALYSVVIGIGLSLALLAITILFNVKIKGQIYFDLWAIIYGVFNTWYFLSQIPANVNVLESDTSYPKGLKIFTQNVLLPLAAIYLLILYAYGVKIILNWNLPEGWVSFLVIGYAGLGILCFLLVHPLRESDEHKWIQFFSKWFYIALYPLIILLCIAIFKRVNQYGITELRYVLIALSVWLTFITTYMLLTKQRNIKIIPITLFFIVLISSVGPLSAFAVAESSQLNRLEKLLIKNKILVNGKIKPLESDTLISTSDSRQVNDIVIYLCKSEGVEKIIKWFPDTTKIANNNEWNRYNSYLIIEAMGVHYNYDEYSRESELDEDNNAQTEHARNYNFSSNSYSDVTRVTGYDYSANFQFYYSFNENQHSFALQLNNDSLKFSMKSKNDSLLHIALNKEEVGAVNLNPMLNNLMFIKQSTGNNYDVAGGLMKLNFKSEILNIDFSFSQVNIQTIKKQRNIQSLSGTILIKLNNNARSN